MRAHRQHHGQGRHSCNCHSNNKQTSLVGDVVRGEEHAREHSAQISACSDNSRNCANSPFVDEWHNGICSPIGHLEKKRKDEHRYNRPHKNIHGCEEHDSQTFEKKKDSQYGESSPKTVSVAGFVSENTSQSAGEEIHQSEETGDDAGFLQPQLKMIDEIKRGYVVDGDLYPKACGVRQEKYPDPVILAGADKACLLLRGFTCIARLFPFYL